MTFTPHACALALSSSACSPACRQPLIAVRADCSVAPHATMQTSGISDELWALELPSILGVAHSDFPDSPEPSSPSALPAHQESGPEHPVSPRPDASPAGPHTTSHRHVPSTSSFEPHPTSADVLFFDLSDTEEGPSPDTQVPAKLAVDSYDSDWNVPSPHLKLVFDLTAVPSDLWRSPAPPTVLVAESQAYALLHQGYATFDDIDTLHLSAGPSTCQTPKAAVRGGPPSPMLLLSGRLYLLIQHWHSAQYHVIPSCGTGADIYSAGSLSGYTVFLTHDTAQCAGSHAH